jgi:hypothetical protein
MRFRPSARRGSSFRLTRLRLELLEDRSVPAAIAWDGGPTGNGTNWLDPTNWRDTNGNDVLPGPNDDVTIGATGSNPTVVLGGDTAVRSVTTNGHKVQLTGGTLTVGATVNKFTTLILDGGTFNPADGASLTGSDITGTGTFTNPAGRTLTATSTDFDATVVNNGTLVAHGTVHFNGGVSAPANSLLRVQGDATNGTANVIFPGGFTNDGTIELTSVLAANNAMVTTTSGALTNTSGATINVLAGAGGSRSVVINNGGSFTNQGALNVGANFTVTHSIGATTSTSGTVTIDPAATLTVSGGSTFTDQGGTVGGGGTLSFTNNVVANIASGVTLTNGPGLTIAPVNTTFTGPGTLANAAGATLNLRDETVNAPLVNNGTLVLRGTVALNSGVFTTAGSATRVLGDSAVGAATLTIGAGGINNAGTFELSSTGTANAATLTVSASTFTNVSGGTVNVLAGTGGTRSITLNSSGQFVNQGAFNLTGTNLSVQAGGPSTFTNAAGGTLTLWAGTTLTDTSAVANSGVIAGGGTIAASISGTGTISPHRINAPAIIPGQVTVNGNVSLGGFIAKLNGTSAGTQYDQLVVNGTVSLSGSLTVTLGYTPAPGDVLRIIDNDGTDPITGTFTGLPEGAAVTFGGRLFTISYTGGTGNDVTLTPGPLPAVSSVQVNGGAAQRSMVTSIAVAFNQVISLPANVADAFILASATPQVIASAGFNDASGLNSDPTANSPYNVNNVNVNGQGAGEPGWLTPWSVGSTPPVVVHSGQSEGDGALFFQGTSDANRTLKLPLSGITSIQAMLMIPSSATGGNTVDFYVRQQANGQIGPDWRVSGDGHLLVVDGHEDGSTPLLDTGFLWTPGTYQAIRIDINTVARTWDFFVDGVRYNAPHPLRYRDAPTYLDMIDILSYIGGPNGTYIDAITVTRNPTVTIGSATAATAGGKTVVTLTNFSGPLTSAGSLIDGRYALRALAGQISANGQPLDGNGDGTPGDDFVYADSGTTTGNQLYRLYGDANGDRIVNSLDLTLFRAAFGSSDPAFDVNGDGVVDQTDLAAFRTNFGRVV